MPNFKNSNSRKRNVPRNGEATKAASIDATLSFNAFPDGMNPSDYQGYEDWSDRRWAWEFLRRNEHFRNACDELKELSPESDEHKKKARQVAKKFKLRQFISYTTPFKEGKDGPWFNPTRVWSNIPSGSASRAVNFRITEGQVAVRFDLLSALDDGRMIKAQILYVESVLNAKLKELRESKHIDAADRKNIKETPGDRLAWLRTLDAKFCNIPHSRIYEQVYPVECQAAQQEGIDKREWPIRLKSLARKAHELADGRYLGIALLYTPARPPSKSSQITE